MTRQFDETPVDIDVAPQEISGATGLHDFFAGYWEAQGLAEFYRVCEVVVGGAFAEVAPPRSSIYMRRKAV